MQDMNIISSIGVVENKIKNMFDGLDIDFSEMIKI